MRERTVGKGKEYIGADRIRAVSEKQEVGILVAIVIRTVLLFFLLSFILKAMGKRQLGELEVEELVSALLISEVAVLPIDDPDLPLLAAVIPALVIVSLEVLLSYIKNKSAALKRAVDGEGVFIIYKGRLCQGALRDNRLSAEEVLAEMRVLGYGDPSEVAYAILEQNGKFSVIPQPSDAPLTARQLSEGVPKGASLAHAVIVDGAVKEGALRRLGYDRAWLAARLKEENVRLGEVFLMTVDDAAVVHTVRREDA